MQLRNLVSIKTKILTALEIVMPRVGHIEKWALRDGLAGEIPWAEFQKALNELEEVAAVEIHGERVSPTYQTPMAKSIYAQLEKLLVTNEGEEPALP